MPNVLLLRGLRAADAIEVGAKAANLGELISAGFPVPDGFCLPVSVYNSMVAPVLDSRLEDLEAQLASGVSAELETSERLLREAVEAVPLSSLLLDDLARAYHSLCTSGAAVAVRSSGISEDSVTASFAGQYRTELEVRSFDGMISGVKRCWASAWTAHSILYRTRHGIPHSAAGMAVVVQLMVEPDAGGVLFTLDPTVASVVDPMEIPISRLDGRIVIESSWGYGDAVVSGLVTPDRHYISRATLRVESITLSRKLLMTSPVSTEAEEGGTAVIDVPLDRQNRMSLAPAQAGALAQLGLAIEGHFGSPQDVEWAIAKGQIAILQARPITHRLDTTYNHGWESPLDGAWWARISICDSWLPEPLSPLFASTLFPSLIKWWLRNWAGSEAEQLNNPLLPKPMFCTINGFAYLRFDYRLNEYPLRTAELILRWFRFHLSPLERRWRTVILPRHIGRIEALRRRNPNELTSDELLQIIHEVQDLSGEYWGIIGGLAWYWNIGEWLLASLYPYAVEPIGNGSLDRLNYGTLLQGYPTKTLDAELALYDLARCDEGDDERDRRFQDFLMRYGHQVYNLDFVDPTPAEQPSFFRWSLERYREGLAEDPRERLRSLAERRDSLHTTIAAALRRSPLRRGLLEAALLWTCHYGRVRDEALFYFTFGWPLMRRGYLELGRRLVAAGALLSAEDVFFLTGDELVRELRTIAHGGALERWDCVVRERRARREAHKLLNPPPQVPPDARIYLGYKDITSLALFGRSAKTGDESTVFGSAVSPGVVTAPARCITSVRDFGKLHEGDVLVARFITPAWSPMLAIAGGVVTDAGGALSHGSIVAREYGIPAVMGTTNATKRILDGQIVTVDGHRGVVYLNA
jgi:pyruvate,water dikinase